MDGFGSKLIWVAQNENALEVEDILTKILVRLPVKSLLICKSVCKYWRGLISSPSFMNLHLIRSQENPSYVFCPSYAVRNNSIHWLIKSDGETTQRLPNFDGFHVQDMICSFNGLICCLIRRKPCTCFIRGSSCHCMDIIIYNPATREVQLVPPPTPRSVNAPRLGISFGPTINGYKLFQFFVRKMQLYECKVYSSITGSWKSIGTVPHLPSTSNHICVNGIVYWLRTTRIDGPEVGYAYILAVDTEEKFSIINIPEEENAYLYLVNLEGCLCLVAEKGLARNRFDIWALQDSKESVWVKKWSDSMPTSRLKEFRYIAVRKNEILLGRCTKYFFYNMGTRTWRDFKWEYRREGGFSSPLAYTESLLPCKYGKIFPD